MYHAHVMWAVSKRVISPYSRLLMKRRGLGRRRVTTLAANRDDKKTPAHTDEIYHNPCKIQMISDPLFDQIFTDVFRKKDFAKETMEKCGNHLQQHGLWDQGLEVSPPVPLKLPALEGNDINNHFENIARQQTHHYKRLLESLVAKGIPEFPKQWVFETGWTKYYGDGRMEKVPFPGEQAIVFDVEVCVTEGQAPTLACAVSTDHWYSWCSKPLCSNVVSSSGVPRVELELQDLIPLETCDGDGSQPGTTGKWVERIVIGHNVSYDRGKVKEQYFLEKTKLRFLDTMSLHIAVSGITSFQRALKMTMKSKNNKNDEEDVKKRLMEDPSMPFDWNSVSSLNNLADVHKLYCDTPGIEKQGRSIFVEGSLEDIRQNFQDLMLYCANDVRATFEILQNLLPKFFERFPHPVTFCGTLEMGSTFLPINSNWKKYLQNSEKAFEQAETDMKKILMQKAEEALLLREGEKYKEDPWMWDMDWKVSKKKKGETISGPPAWYKKLMYKETDPEYKPGPAKISSSMQIVPKLMRMTWCGFPLHHSKTGKWGFLIKTVSPKEEGSDYGDGSGESLNFLHEGEEETDNKVEADGSKFPYEQWEEFYEESKNKLLRDHDVSRQSMSTRISTHEELRQKSEDAVQDLSDLLVGLRAISGGRGRPGYVAETGAKAEHSPHPQCEFIPLPHKGGPNCKVGSPLSKDFLPKIEEGILGCVKGSDAVNKVMSVSKQASYWRNNRDRILGQVTVWYPTDNKTTEESYGVILPQVVVSGTLTRRAVEPTWMTASNAYEDRIGSELKGMIQAPDSFHFVGADVDSQELWLASIIGDAYFAGQHGCTALGWMTLQGKKSSGTDMHSKTASVTGISRDQSKVLNYARIYGAGVKFAETLLLQFNKNMTIDEARKKARAMYKMTKGVREYLLNEEGQSLASQMDEFKSRTTSSFSKRELQKIMTYHQISFHDYLDLVDRQVWNEGTESYMFNKLEEIAQQDTPATPILGSLISRSLVPAVVHDNYLTSRVNWVVQSSAVDYLHVMLTCMGWLIKKYNLQARFSISVHDEVRYLVRSEDRYRVALALQITNLFTRAFCSYRLGMNELPESVAFFSCVDVDKVLRKEVNQDCVTPSNPQGLSGSFNIPHGEALDIWGTIKLTNGSLLPKTGAIH